MSIRLLVADDDPLMRTLVAITLSDVADVAEAADGIEALDRLRREHFDLLLLDWDMPGCNGVEILNALRQQGCTTPVIMVTAKNERGNVLQALHANASDYLIKPFETATLRQKVKKWLATPRAEEREYHAR